MMGKCGALWTDYSVLVIVMCLQVLDSATVLVIQKCFDMCCTELWCFCIALCVRKIDCVTLYIALQCCSVASCYDLHDFSVSVV